MFKEIYKMLYLNIFLKVSIILSSICLIDIACLHIEGKGPLPNPQFLFDYLKYFTKSVNTRRSFEPFDKTILEKTIRHKVQELKPFLQDNDNNEIVEMATSDTEDTIVEDDIELTKRLQDDNELEDKATQFKILREKIRTKLIHESISDTTSQFILQAVDNLIDKIGKSQCDLKQSRKVGVNQPITVMLAWKKQWKKIKQSFTNSLLKYKQAHMKTQLDSGHQTFIDHVIKLSNYISNDIDHWPDQYKVTCQVSNVIKDKADINTFRNKNEAENKMDTCKNFKVCSVELQDYLLNYYEKINDTAVGFIRNYAEMYARDVQLNTDIDKESIIPTLRKISEITEKNVPKIFIKEVNNLKLEKNKSKDANLNILKKFTNNTLLRVKVALLTTLSKELGKLNIITLIEDDIRLTAEVDLHNLQRDLIEKLCNTFQFCNGDYNGRKSNRPLQLKLKKTYVVMHLDEDHVTEASTDSPTTTILNKKNATVVTRTTLYNFNKTD